MLKLSMDKLRYLRSSAVKTVLGRGFACPSCGETRSTTVDRKWLVTALRRCDVCKLLFRTPTTSVEENNAFYQSDYEQGFTTDMPSDAELARLTESQFAGHEKDYGNYIEILRASGVANGARLFDFGCSWGYGSYQLARAGFSVESFEISKPRADFARRKLGVAVRPVTPADRGQFDVFFSAHVIEHVPSVGEMIDLGMSLLKPGGLFVALTPNGSLAFRQSVFEAWHKLWGQVHPQLIDNEFIENRFRGFPFFVGASPHSLVKIKEWASSSNPVAVVGELNGIELMFAVRKIS